MTGEELGEEHLGKKEAPVRRPCLGQELDIFENQEAGRLSLVAKLKGREIDWSRVATGAHTLGSSLGYQLEREERIRLAERVRPGPVNRT